MRNRKMKGILLAGAVAMTVVGLGVGVHDFNFAAIAIEADETEEFVIEDGVLTAYNGDGGDVVIPEGVTSIGERAFYWCGSLTSVVIPEGVTSIGDYAFFWCDSLTSVVMPEGVTSIGDDAFNGCSSLTSVEIPEGVTSIGSGAFKWCDSLTSVELPESVTSIASSTFYGCSSLTSIEIPESVTDIGSDAFGGCSSLTSIEVSSGNTNYASCDGILYSADMQKLIQCPGEKEGVVEIPKGVICIGASAFDGCSNVISVEIPESITNIGDYAFSGCSSLTSVEIPEGVTSIGYGAFSGCSSLTSMVIPEDVTEIGGYAFYKCSGLISVEIPESVTSIGDGAFYCCSNLKNVSLAEGLETIGHQVFFSCESLEEMWLPASVTQLGSSVFGYCPNLKSIEVSADNENYTSVDGLLYSKDLVSLIQCPAAKQGALVLPEGVEAIWSSAFGGCKGITSIAFPSSISSEYVDYYDFEDCESLEAFEVSSDSKFFASVDGLLYTVTQKSVTTEYVDEYGDTCYSVTWLDEYEPYELMCCPKAKQGAVEVPEGVKKMGSNAFQNCVGLTSVKLPSSIAYSDFGAVFSGCTKLESIEVAEGNTSCSSYDGIVYNATMTTLIECPEGRQGAVVIPDGVTKVEMNAFVNCKKITSVEIPATVTSVSYNAFGCCEALEYALILNPEVDLPIWDHPFSDCSNVTLYGWSESTTETFANDKGISFVAIDKAEDYEAYTTGAYSDNWTFHVEVVEASELPGDAAEKVTENDVIYHAYMEILGEYERYLGGEEFLLPLPEGFDATETYVYFVDTVGNITEMEAEIIGSFLKFEVLESGYYVFTESEITFGIPGDVNADGVVDMKDVVLMKRHIAGWTINGDVTVADVNADGAVDMKDVVLVKRYIAGWDVTLGE